MRYVLVIVAGDTGRIQDGGHWVALCEVESKLMGSPNHVRTINHVTTWATKRLYNSHRKLHHDEVGLAKRHVLCAWDSTAA